MNEEEREVIKEGAKALSAAYTALNLPGNDSPAIRIRNAALAIRIRNAALALQRIANVVL